jgi:hypothetical protein
MPSSNRQSTLGFAVALVAISLHASPARAQQAQGFAVERFYPSAPGGGWFVMDALDMQRGLGGAASATIGYARNPLTVSDGAQRLAVVSDQAFANFGIAATYQRWRVYLNMEMPLVIYGHSGTAGTYSFTGPSVDLGTNPDTLSDARVGVDVRLIGEATSRLRLGLGAQLIIPSGSREFYDTDGTYRGMIRALLAGDIGRFTYAGHVGVHIRPLDDGPTPGSPNGSEFLFGVAGGARLRMGQNGGVTAVLGPEVFGETAFRTGATGIEGLLTGRLEWTGSGPNVRVRVGVGAGLDPQFGAPDWRIVVGVELFGHAQEAGARAPD